MIVINNEEYIRFIEEHINEELSVEVLANHFGYSRAHFSRMFKSQMNISVMNYVWKRRLAVAIDKMLDGEKISDIAIELKWESSSNFYKSFKKEYGYKPSIVKMVVAAKNTLKDFGRDKMRKETKNEVIEELKGYVSIGLVELADLTYKGMKRYSGEEYIMHPLNVARILVYAEASPWVVEAGLFCDAYRKVDGFDSKNLPKKVRKIVNELPNDWNQLSEDALLVKIAERLHNMRTIEFMSKERQIEKTRETINLFLPVARKIGHPRMIEELNRLSIESLLNCETCIRK
ncbi:GTP pyrophosphokinase, (p)ppGpp synthetase I [Lachnospiraceae bacterium TWA4]|nr:GTP pyrophosphokinase, (p)ppGpp synthetase I [Lachnospiraceae bacterium TWA4]